MLSDRLRRRAFFLLAALVAASFMMSICIGKYPLSLSEILAILSGNATKEINRNVFYTLRVPRTVMALMAGMGLGMAGNIYQIIFKNPLASPDIIGVSSGANLGAAIAIVLFGHNTFLLAASAFAGGLLIMLLVITLVRYADHSTTTYILAGIIMKAVSEACIMILKFFADPGQQLAAIEFWSMGSFGNITAQKLLTILPIFMTGMAGLILLRRQIALLGLEEDESRALGVNMQWIRFAVITFSTLTVASVICLTGLITFVGLIAPHIARLVLKRTSFASCVFASLAGAFILLTADCFARSLYSAEIPISILTTFIGVPVLVYFMRSRKVGRI